MKKLLILSLACFTLFSCKKDKEETCTLSSTAILGNFKISAVRYKASASAPEQDVLNTYFPNACERDDIVTLNSNGTFMSTDAGVACVPPGTYSGAWSLSGNTFTFDGEAYNVDDYQCNSVTVSQANYLTAGDKLTIVMARQ